MTQTGVCVLASVDERDSEYEVLDVEDVRVEVDDARILPVKVDVGVVWMMAVTCTVEVYVEWSWCCSCKVRMVR